MNTSGDMSENNVFSLFVEVPKVNSEKQLVVAQRDNII